jgi:hypothetical protein
MLNTTETIKATIQVDWYTIACALASGMEGGIGYWAKITDYREPAALERTLDKLSAEVYGEKPGKELNIYRHIDYVLNEGGGVQLQECERDESKAWLTLEGLRRGVQLMADQYPKHFADLAANSGDAITGDVLVQLAVFGELIYG